MAKKIIKETEKEWKKVEQEEMKEEDHQLELALDVRELRPQRSRITRALILEGKNPRVDGAVERLDGIL